MNIRDLLRAFGLLLFCATLLRAELPSDGDATAKLVGTWDVEANGVKGTDNFKSDGTFTGSASGLIQTAQVTITVEGKWSVKDGILSETITKSDHPELVPAGSITRDKLIELTDKTYKARAESGTLEIHTKR